MAGDTANSAARLQQSAEPGEILLAESTFRLVRESVDAELLRVAGAQGQAGSGRGLPAARASGEGSELAPRLEAPLVGRQDALAQLEWALERTVAERGCRLVTVVGAPGIGKSRLAHEFVTHLGERATVLRGRCLPYGEGITFWPLAEMVKAGRRNPRE